MKVRVLVAAAAAMLLVGCGSVHPGAAAVVGDTTISMGRADDTAKVYCQLALLSTQAGTPISNADVRRQAVTDLVYGVVAREMAAKQKLTPNPSAYEVSPAQRKEIAKSFPAGQVDHVVDAVIDSQRTYAIAELLGEKKVTDPDAEATQLQEVGLKQIQAEVAHSDVRFDPRFGIGRDGRQKAATGSLSVPVHVPSESDQKGLPATQRCSS
jgi:hypothetical protein